MKIQRGDVHWEMATERKNKRIIVNKHFFYQTGTVSLSNNARYPLAVKKKRGNQKKRDNTRIKKLKI